MPIISICLQYFGLEVKYTDDLPGQVYGMLDNSEEPRFIVVRSNLPEYEEIFTIAHELGHAVMHPSFKPRRIHSNWFVRQKWQSPILAKIARATRLECRKLITPEWEADLWAMLFLLWIGDVDNLKVYIKHHPEKTNLLLIAATVSIYKGAPRVIKAKFQRMFHWLSPS